MLLRLAILLSTIGAFAVLLLVTPSGYHPSSAAGCYPGKPHMPGTSAESIATVEGKRGYRLHVPASYNGADHVPLVLNFHGLGATAANQEFYSGFSQQADAPNAGFIVVYPEGAASPDGYQYWNILQDAAPAANDVTFVGALLDKLEHDLCIDSQREFATGASNGGMMSVRLACSLSSRIAAIAPVAGAYYPPIFSERPTEACQDTRPVPLLAFHGTADTLIPFDGGPSASGETFRLPLDNATPSEDVMQDWAAHNGCIAARQETSAGANVRLISYGSCGNNATAELYAIDGGEHTWPTTGSDGIDATSLIWAFFREHPMAGYTTIDTDGDTVPDETDADNDNDGCPDAREVGANERLGGRRDAKNPYDYFNPTHDRRNRMDDVVAVLNQYFIDKYLPSPSNEPPRPNPGYRADTDRTLTGPNPWNLGPGDGQQRLDDVRNVLSQYSHDCA